MDITSSNLHFSEQLLFKLQVNLWALSSLKKNQLLGKCDKGGKTVRNSILLPEEANWMHVNF